MFGVPFNGPTNVFYDQEAVYKNVINPDSVLNKKHHSTISYHDYRQNVFAETIRLANENFQRNLTDLFTKTMNKSKRDQLIGNFI